MSSQFTKTFENDDVIMLVNSIRDSISEEDSLVVEEFYSKYQHLFDEVEIKQPIEYFEYKTFIPSLAKVFEFDEEHVLLLAQVFISDSNDNDGRYINGFYDSESKAQLLMGSFFVWISLGDLKVKLVSSLPRVLSSKVIENGNVRTELLFEATAGASSFDINGNMLASLDTEYFNFNFQVKLKLDVEWSFRDSSIKVTMKEENYKNIRIPDRIKHSLFGDNEEELKIIGYSTVVDTKTLCKK